jgi:hypothetical protein
MELLWDFLANPTFHNEKINAWFGWLSALACFLISYFAAWRIRSHPRLFTSLALFAGTWVLIMGATSSRLIEPKMTGLPDRAVDIASFLFVFSGAILAREAPADSFPRRARQIVEVAALWLLFSLVLPNQILAHTLFSPDQLQLFLGEALGDLGFFSLALGASAVAGPRLFRPFVAVLVVYAGLSAARTLELWHVVPGETRHFTAAVYAYLFIAARLLTTGLFVAIVLGHARASQEPEEALSSGVPLQSQAAGT